MMVSARSNVPSCNSCLLWMLFVQSSSSTIETCDDVWNNFTNLQQENALLSKTDKYTFPNNETIRCGFVDLGNEMLFIGAMTEHGSLTAMQTTLESCPMYKNCP
eukprot:406337_1